MGFVSSYRPTYLRPTRIDYKIVGGPTVLTGVAWRSFGFTEQARETLEELHEACHEDEQAVPVLE
jgi:hypothetical protein